MSRRYIYIVLVVLIAFGAGYLISQSNPQSVEQDTSVPKKSSKTLDLSGQQLTTISDEVLNQTDITVLNLSNNQLVILPANIANMVNLEVLNIENNRLETLPQEISKLTNVREILLNNNRMKNIPAGLGTMTWLKLLDISGNAIPVSEINQLKEKLPSTQVKS